MTVRDFLNLFGKTKETKDVLGVYSGTKDKSIQVKSSPGVSAYGPYPDIIEFETEAA